MGHLTISDRVPSMVLTLGLALLPIAVDKVTSLFLRALPSDRLTPTRRWAFVMLPTAAAVYWASGFFKPLSSILAGCLYFVYKSNDFLNAINLEAKENNPANILEKKLEKLSAILTFPYQRSRNVQEIADEVRKRWKDRKTIQLFDEMMQLAVQQMQELYDKLQNKAVGLRGTAAHKKMAEELKNLVSEGSYRSFVAKSASLFHLYRAARGLKFFEKRGSETFVGFLMQHEQKEADSQPFFTEGTFQSQWRDDYHEMVDFYIPIMEELEKLPNEDDPYAKLWIEMCVRDEEQQIAQKDDPRLGVFKLQ